MGASEAEVAERNSGAPTAEDVLRAAKELARDRLIPSVEAGSEPIDAGAEDSRELFAALAVLPPNQRAAVTRSSIAEGASAHWVMAEGIAGVDYVMTVIAVTPVQVRLLLQPRARRRPRRRRAPGARRYG